MQPPWSGGQIVCRSDERPEHEIVGLRVGHEHDHPLMGRTPKNFRARARCKGLTRGLPADGATPPQTSLGSNCARACRECTVIMVDSYVAQCIPSKRTVLALHSIAFSYAVLEGYEGNPVALQRW